MRTPALMLDGLVNKETSVNVRTAATSSRAHLGAGCNGFHGPAVQRDKLQSGGQDPSLQLLLGLILFILVFALVVSTSSWRQKKNRERRSVTFSLSNPTGRSFCRLPGAGPLRSSVRRMLGGGVLLGRVCLVVLVEARGRR